MAPWTIPWGLPWGKAIDVPLFLIVIAIIVLAGAWFGGTIWYARDKVDFEVRVRSERV